MITIVIETSWLNIETKIILIPVAPFRDCYEIFTSMASIYTSNFSVGVNMMFSLVQVDAGAD